MKFKLIKKEIYLLLGFSFLLIIISSLPYIYLQQNTPDGLVYGGASYINPADNYVYYSYINQAKQGAWLLQNLYTSEQTISTIRPFWTILGKIAGLFSWSAVFTFHFFRVVLIPVFVFVAYYCLGLFVNNIREKFLSLVIFFTTAGFGWLWMLFKPFFWFQDAWQVAPFDFIRAFSFPFISILSSPHFIISWILIIFILSQGFVFLQDRKETFSFIVVLSANFLFLLHPFSIPLIFIILFGWWFYQTLKIKKIFTHLTLNFILFLFFSSPSVLYYIYLYFFNTEISIKTLQNYLISPSLAVVLISFGPMFLFALFGFFVKYKKERDNKKIIFLIYWAIINGLLIYLPVLWQRRLAQGWFFPLSILAAGFVFDWHKKMIDKYKSWDMRKYFIYVPLFLFFILSNLNIIYLNYFFRRQNYNYLYYYPKTLVAAGKYLSQHTKNNDVILSNTIRTSVLIPYLVNRKVFLGHSVETLFADAKLNLKNLFFTDSATAEEKKRILNDYGIDFVVYEKYYKNDFQPTENLQLVWQNDDYFIFKVFKK